jgi:hypothetical protein
LEAIRSIPPPLPNLESISSRTAAPPPVPLLASLPPPLEHNSTPNRRKKKDDVEDESSVTNRKKSKKIRGKDEETDVPIGEAEEEGRGTEIRRFRSIQEQTWANAEDRKRPCPLPSPSVKVFFTSSSMLLPFVLLFCSLLLGCKDFHVVPADQSIRNW